MHRMSDVMVTRCSSREETVLADVVIEALEASEAQTNDGIFFTDLAFGLVLHALSAGQTMEGRNPDHTLWLLL